MVCSIIYFDLFYLTIAIRVGFHWPITTTSFPWVPIGEPRVCLVKNKQVNTNQWLVLGSFFGLVDRLRWWWLLGWEERSIDVVGVVAVFD